jgi:hypothetical protein
VAIAFVASLIEDFAMLSEVLWDFIFVPKLF